MVFETYYICGCSFCIQVAWSSVIVIPSCVLKFWCENQHEFGTFKNLDAWNLVCLSVKGVRGMRKIFGTKIKFHSRTFEFLCLWWHSYVQPKTWSCWKICLAFDSVCESAWSWNSSQKWMSCLILLVSNFDDQLNFLIFIERDFFLSCDESSPPTHVNFWTSKILKSCGELTVLSDIPVFFASKMWHFWRVEFWVLDWPCLGHSKLEKILPLF